MKKFIAISAIALVMTGCSASSAAAELRTSAVVQQPHTVVVSLLDTISDKQLSFIRSMEPHINKTWYVFSGASPSGWDCSGMTMWAYSQIGVVLEHRASKQQTAGLQVWSPKRGDVVVFTYKGSKSAYHVGLYLSKDKMVHAGGGKGEQTSIVSISKFAGKYSKVTYRRILESL
jgi:cell wall-associated NlpC family hydrolase